MKNKTGNVLKGLMVAGIMGGVLSGAVPTENTSSSEVHAASKVTPTIFVHGYLGDNSSLSGLVLNLTKAKKDDELSYSYSYKNLMGGMKKTSVDLVYSGQRMTYVVGLNNTLTPLDMAKTFGKTKGKKDYRNDYSVIHFANSSMSLNDQEKYLNAVAGEEAKRFKTDRVNIVGHSMGGLLGAQYMIHASKGITRTKLANLVTVGSPIKGANYTDAMFFDTVGGSRSYVDLKDGGKVLKEAFKAKKAITSTRVMSFGSDSDKIVKYKSAVALGEIVNASKFKSYKVKSGHTKYFDGSVGKDIAKKVASQLK